MPCAVPDHLIRAHTGLAQAPQVERAFAFGKAHAGGVVEQRHMRILRVGGRQIVRAQTGAKHLPTQPDLQCGGTQQVTAAHHVAHAHEQVVHRHHELVRIQAVGTAQNHIAQLAAHIERLRAIHKVVECDEGAGLLRTGHRQAP